MKVLFRGKKYADLSDLVEDLRVRFRYELKHDVISSDYTGGRWSLK